MQLADFIANNYEPILSEWVAFAAVSGPAGKTMDVAMLRDHALAMLKVIVADLRAPQTDAEQIDKSKGTADSGPGTPDTAAEVHGAGRAASGFTLAEMVSEYRALRASVIRLWAKDTGALMRDADLDDMMRFNEAIDQATAESITRFTQDLDHSKEMFLAILSHDLRTPLGAIIMSSKFMLDAGGLEEPNLTLTATIARSAQRMNAMVGDLLDLTRTRLGTGIPIVRADMDMAIVARHAIEEVSAAHPDRVLHLTTTGDLRGAWDASRIGQVLANLLGNAVQHGSAKEPITLTVTGDAKEIVVRVTNAGDAIPAVDLPGLFNPLKRLTSSDTARDSSHLGLGLYIADRIVSAHNGAITVKSSAGAGTVVTVRLPR